MNKELTGIKLPTGVIDYELVHTHFDICQYCPYSIVDIDGYMCCTKNCFKKCQDGKLDEYMGD